MDHCSKEDKKPMYRNRLQQQFTSSRLAQPSVAEFSAPCRLAQPLVTGMTAVSFVLVPLAWLPHVTPEQLVMQQWIYQRAFEQAQAIARPSLPERDLLGVWN